MELVFEVSSQLRCGFTLHGKGEAKGILISINFPFMSFVHDLIEKGGCGGGVVKLMFHNVV